jgi:hypothetical protein
MEKISSRRRGSVAIVIAVVVVAVVVAMTVAVLFLVLGLPFRVLHLPFSVALVNFLSADLARRHPSRRRGRRRAPPTVRRTGRARGRADHASARKRRGQRNGNDRIPGYASHEPPR